MCLDVQIMKLKIFASCANLSLRFVTFYNDGEDVYKDFQIEC